MGYALNTWEALARSLFRISCLNVSMRILHKSCILPNNTETGKIQIITTTSQAVGELPPPISALITETSLRRWKERGPGFALPKEHKLTAWVESISLMLWSYCSAKMANFRVCSSLSRFRTALCSLFGVVSSRWFLNALYCLVWILQVSWNCFFIWSSLDWEGKKKIYNF